jgi:hypothetical protein
MRSPGISFTEDPSNPNLVRCNYTGVYVDRREALGDKMRDCSHNRCVHRLSQTVYLCEDCGRHLHSSQI